MRKIALYIIVMLSTCSALAQSLLEQKGVTYRYNGKNPRTSLGGVYVKAATSPNGVVSDSQNGVFVLKLQNVKMGDRLGMTMARKNGMMIFNQQAVDEWSARKEPLKLILCDADEFQKQKNNLIAIGRSQAEKIYRKMLAEIEKKNKAQQLTLDEYYAKLDSIEKELKNAQSHMEEYADMFARIDESEIDTLAQRAIELFNQGQLEESIKLFEQGNYLEKLDDALKVKAQAADLLQKADSAEMLASKDIEEYQKSIEAQVAAYKMKNDWDKAGELLKGLADKLQTLDAIGVYACFAQNQNKFTEAEKEYELYIKKISSNANPQVYEPNLATSYNNLANLYSDTQRFNEAEQMYKSAIEIRKRLAAANPQAYEPNLATSYNNLANLYYTTLRFNEAEQMHKSALDIRKRLAAANPQAYEPDLATSYNNLANLYYTTQRFNEAERMHKAALEILKRLADANPQAYDSDLAASYNNLALLYSDTQRFNEAEQIYKAALEIHKRLAAANPQAYEPNLATSYNNLANLYYTTQRFNEAEQIYKAALEIRKRLAAANPQAYEPDLAASYFNIAVLYNDTQRYTDSEQMYKSALEIYKRLADANPQAYEPDLADSYNYLARLYSKTQRYVESEQMCKAAITIYEQLHISAPQQHQYRLAYGYYWYGMAMINNSKYHDAIAQFERSLKLCKDLMNDETGKSLYVLNLAWLVDLYSNDKDYATAYTYNKELLPLQKANYGEDADTWKSGYCGKLISQSFYANLLGKFEEGELHSLEALKVDSTQHLAYTNLAAAYLLQGKYQAAEKLYRQYKSEFKEEFLTDFDELAKAGVIPVERLADVDKIKKMLNE